ncbi:MAG: DUF3656 domain-containing protein [Bacilli bacterium]
MKELLSPAGNIECLKSAINNGADAVYLGGKSFGARAYAGNFNKEELLEATNYAHLYGVKIYVTVNTIIYNNEIEEFLDYIKYLYQIGVDALIMQDIGMISLVRKKFPNIDIHASTQIHNHNNEGIKLLKDLGVTRVVLDREMSLEDIEKINVDIEKEVFIHGALCNSYSGCCFFSSMNGDRSGNRGECTQPCRLPYKLIKNGKYIDTSNKYLLSTKELNTTKNFDKLMESDIVSFKIEGRMKSPSYVGYVTRIYRKLIDNYKNNSGQIVNQKEENNLKILFNRNFTSGYLFSDKVMNTFTSNHQGLEIGKVLEVTSKKIKIKLYNDLYQEDGIRFKNSNKGMIVNFIYNEKNLLINKASTGDIIYLDNKINLKDKDTLIKTSSNYLDKEILSVEEKKILININVLLKDNYLEISFSDIAGNIVKDKVPVDIPLNRSTTNNEIIEKLSKLGGTPFIINNIIIDINKDIFVNMKDLNNIRRLLVDKLIIERTKVKRNIIINNIKLDYKENKDYNYEISVLARTKDQVKASIDMNVDRIYVDEDLYNIYKDNNKVYLRLPRVVNEYNYNSKNILATELGAINKYKNSDINLISDYYLNVVNNYSIKFLLDHNVKRVTLSPEINYNHLEEYIKDKVELLVYGKVELMLTKSCPIKEVNICPCNKEDIYYLEDINKNKYRILHSNCLTHIMHYKNIDYLDKIEYYKSIGIKSFRLELLDEDYNETIKLINNIKNK